MTEGNCLLCSSRKISIRPEQKGLEFPWGGAFSNNKEFKEMYEARSIDHMMKLYWDFHRGGEGREGMDIRWNYTLNLPQK